MTFAPKQLLIASLLAATGVIATAQTPAPAAPAAPAAATAPAAGETNAQRTRGERGPRDPAEFRKRMAERHAKHQAELKSALKLSPAQEGAWTQFTGAMQPPAPGERPRMDREEFKKLTTPQRIDLMEKRGAERQARMKQRGEAVKAFYAQLTPEQQKVFDERGLRHGKGDGPRGGHRGGHHGHHGGAR